MVRLTVTDELLAQAIRDTDWARVDALTDEEIEAAVAADPDAAPIREPEAIAAAAVATLRAATGLSQEEFAAAYAIPLDTLRDWETARAAPDAVATAYLRVIRRDPRAVARALAA